MTRRAKRPWRAVVGVVAIVLSIVAIGALVLRGKSIDVLQPAGVIADKQLDLMIFTVALTMVVIVPVFVLLFFMAWRYREDNPKKTKYSPDDEGSPVLESIWWGVPFIIITVLGVATWISTHDLDPYKPISGMQPSLEVQVISLDWKWLFIYPEQRVASVNELYIPVDRPIHFSLAGDSAMSAMWIPKLGSQVYAMKGMSTQLNLKATEEGVYRGSNSNITGAGYAGMNFKVHVVSRGEWNVWLKEAEKGERLDTKRYNQLAKPSRGNAPKQFALANPNLYSNVVMKYMGHSGLGVPKEAEEYTQIDHSAHGGAR